MNTSFLRNIHFSLNELSEKLINLSVEVYLLRSKNLFNFAKDVLFLKNEAPCVCHKCLVNDITQV